MVPPETRPSSRRIIELSAGVFPYIVEALDADDRRQETWRWSQNGRARKLFCKPYYR